MVSKTSFSPRYLKANGQAIVEKSLKELYTAIEEMYQCKNTVEQA